MADDSQLELALEVNAEVLLQVFSEDDIADVLDAESGVNHRLIIDKNNLDLPKILQGWVADEYRQEGFELAYRYNGDYRDKSLPEEVGQGEQGCDFAWFISDDRKYGLEFRVFDGGRTEVHFCVYEPLRKIEALWPAKQN